MDADNGIPIQHIPLSVRINIAKYLDIGTEHTWEFLAECMGLDVVSIMVSCCVFNLLCCLLAIFCEHFIDAESECSSPPTLCASQS